MAHFRRPESRRIECGQLYGPVTAVREEVTCGQCVTVMKAAHTLAEAFGCRNEALHSPVARVQIEVAQERSRCSIGIT